MSKDKISDYSSTSAGANLNTDIAGINIDEGCPPSGINNAIRALMSQIKDLQTGVSGDTIPVASGGTGRSTLTANNVILGNGTSQVNFVAPGSSGNVLTSDGSTWTSVAVASASFDSGTLMLFQQTTAPTGWTKQTTHDNKALRVVSGTASSGGSVAFTTAFASQTPSGSVSITSITGSAGATTLATNQIPSHTHNIAARNANTEGSFVRKSNDFNALDIPTGAAGGGGSHNHSFSFSSGSASFSGNAINLAVQYVDLIIASKD